MKGISFKNIIITAVIGAVITGVVTVGVNLITEFIKTEPVSLIYSVDNVVPFSGNSGTIGIYRLQIMNNGKKMIEEMALNVELQNAKIEQSNVSENNSLDYNEKIENGYKLYVKNLNPSESIAVSLLASSSNALPARPDINLRGKGIVGVEKANRAESGLQEILFKLLGPITASYATLFVLYFAIRNNFLGLGHTIGIKQKEIFAYLCGMHGLSDDFDRFANLHGDISFWFGADRLTYFALNSCNQDKCNKVRGVLIDLLKYNPNFAPSSRAIIYYNIAKLSKYLGNDEEKNDNLENARKLDAKTIKVRMEIDKYFD